MIRRVAAAMLVLVVITGAGCAGSETTAQPAPATIGELEAAVQPAAQALLDARALEVTTLWFDENGSQVRADWLDYRHDGTFMLVNQSLSSTSDAMAWIQLDGDSFCATSGPGLYCDIDNPQTIEPWARYNRRPVESNATQIPIPLDIESMAASVNAEGVPEDEMEASRHAESDGAIVWTLDNPLGEGSLTREWTIDAAGFLRSYTAGSETGLPFGLYSKMEFGFVVGADPSPIAPPLVGTPLDLNALDLPTDLPLLDR